MKALIDLITKQVKGINRQKGLFEFEVEIFDINPQKVVNGQTYNLLENPSLFSFDEIAQAKGLKLTSDNMSTYIILNEELDENDLDLKHSQHSAHTGFKFLQLKPQGVCYTKAITLPEAANSIKPYVEADTGINIQYSTDGTNFSPFTDSISIDTTVKQIFLEFVNTTTNNAQIYSYGILL